MWLNELYQASSPIAFSLGPIVIRWYGLAYLAGFTLAGLCLWRTQRRWGLDLTSDDVLNIVIGVAFGVIIGARVAYVLFYGAGYYLTHPLEIFLLNQGGMSFHGGLVGAIVGGSLVCRSSKISIPTVADLAVIGAPIGLFFGRCANFVNGELWGKPTDLPWGVMFADTGGGNVYRHPSQLYEALLEGVVLFIVLYAAAARDLSGHLPCPLRLLPLPDRVRPCARRPARLPLRRLRHDGPDTFPAARRHWCHTADSLNKEEPSAGRPS